MIWLDIIEDGAWEDGADEWSLLGWDDDRRPRVLKKPRCPVCGKHKWYPNLIYGYACPECRRKTK